MIQLGQKRRPLIHSPFNQSLLVRWNWCANEALVCYVEAIESCRQIYDTSALTSQTITKVNLLQRLVLFPSTPPTHIHVTVVKLGGDSSLCAWYSCLDWFASHQECWIECIFRALKSSLYLQSSLSERWWVAFSCLLLSSQVINSLERKTSEM